MAKQRPKFEVDPTSFTKTSLPKSAIIEPQPVEVVRERKTRRIQVLTYDSLVERMDAAAKKHGLSRAELIEKVMTEYLDNNNS